MTIQTKEVDTHIALIKKDVDTFAQLFGRIDITLEKMSAVSNDVSRLLALHEQRIDNLQEADKILEVKLEKHSTAFSEEIKELHDHIRNNNRDLIDKLRTSEDSIKSEIKSVRDAVDRDNKHLHTAIEDTNKSLSTTNKRIDSIERWKWIVIGGAIIIGWLINKLPISFSIT